MKLNDESICKPISVFMEVVSVLPELTLDKTMLNFWECKLYERKYITVRITNKNDELPLDFKFNKVQDSIINLDSTLYSRAQARSY